MNAKLATICLALALSPLPALVGCNVADAPKIAGSSVRIELPTSLGSGVYIGNGIIITAAHVVAEAPNCRTSAWMGSSSEKCAPDVPPTVRLVSDSGDIQDGEVLWVNKEYDIAAVRPSNPKRFMAADLACRLPIVGEALSAVGNPLGMQFITMHGYVSGAARELEPKWKSAFITDITTISGMSGGPVYDTDGQVIGITVGSLDPNVKPGPDGIVAAWGFSVPSSVVCSLLGRA